MTRKGERHPNKDIRKAIKEAQNEGWTLERSSGGGHRWGTLRCGFGCKIGIWGTPRQPTTSAKRIGEAVQRCSHLT